ncbi:hypothetical protein R20233_02803 [Ralstonia sp. LMG 32965]|nr:hypothetical protein R20233_02803 [Ralstonia sp. LMG 32965]
MLLAETDMTWVEYKAGRAKQLHACAAHGAKQSSPRPQGRFALFMSPDAAKIVDALRSEFVCRIDRRLLHGRQGFPKEGRWGVLCGITVAERPEMPRIYWHCVENRAGFPEISRRRRIKRTQRRQKAERTQSTGPCIVAARNNDVCR